MDSMTLTPKQLRRVASEVEQYAGVCAGSARYTARRLPPDSEQLRYPSAESVISMRVALDDKETSFPMLLTLRISATINNDMPIGGHVAFNSIPGSLKKMVMKNFENQPITKDGLTFSTSPMDDFVVPIRSGHKLNGYYGEVVYGVIVELSLEE